MPASAERPRRRDDEAATLPRFPLMTELRWLFPPFAPDRLLNMGKMMPSMPGIGPNGFCHISRARFGVNELPIEVLLGQGT